ncbi:MAG: hypothetical protein HY825_13430 [Acidobacteria bacterium]|nr:hypothetical protein [Acidobacteriota bacterium]
MKGCPYCDYFGRTCFAHATPQERELRNLRGTAAVHEALGRARPDWATKANAAAARLKAKADAIEAGSESS